jgi:hypothetical protein
MLSVGGEWQNHEGVSNPCLMLKKKSALAARYESPAEQYFIPVALRTESRFVSQFVIRRANYERRFREWLVSGVLATDLREKQLKELRKNQEQMTSSKKVGRPGKLPPTPTTLYPRVGVIKPKH